MSSPISSASSSSTTQIDQIDQHIKHTPISSLRKNSKRQEYITIAGHGKSMGITTQESLASTTQEIASFVSENFESLQPKQLKLLKQYAIRNIDPDLLKIWILTQRSLHVRFERNSVCIHFSTTGEAHTSIVETCKERSPRSGPTNIDLIYLIDNEVKDVRSFQIAAKMKLKELAWNERAIFLETTINDAVQFISEELFQLLNNQSLYRTTDLAERLLDSVNSHNTKVEFIDKTTFGELIRGAGVPHDLLNAPEYRQVLAAYRNNVWEDDELKPITFTHMLPATLEAFQNVVKIFSTNPEVVTAIRQVLPKRRLSRRKTNFN